VTKTYIIIEGGVKTPEGMKGPGDELELDEKDAKAMDPQGTSFMLKSQHEAKKKAAEAAKKAEAEALAAAAKAEAEAKAKADAEAKKKAAEGEKGGK
jgi:membrane protein involved in colicin uptake